MVALGLLAAAYLLQADFDRRREQFVKSRLPEEGRQAEPSRRRVSHYWHRRLAGLVGHVCITFWKALEI